MPLVNAGRDFIAAAIVNDGPPTFFDNGAAHLGVGDSTDAFDPADTDLQAVTNKFRRPMEATYPQIAGNVLTLRSLFAAGEANFAWQEWGSFNNVSGGVMLSRLVEDLGTKDSSKAWQMTIELTVTAA
jgi:hypothetical protein